MKGRMIYGKVMRVSLIALCLCMMLSAESYAQSENATATPQPQGDLYSRNVSFGLVGDANLNEHFTGFQFIPGYPSCSPTISHGVGIGGSFGAAANMPIGQKFSIGLRGVYSLSGANLLENEGTTISVGGVATPANIQHTIATTLGLFDLEPTLNYDLFGAFHVYAGFGLGYLAKTFFDQKEALTEPANSGTFTNGSRTEDESTGALPNASKLIGSIVGGVSYMLPLNAAGSLHALPELSWSEWMTSPVKGLPWNVGSLRGGMSIMYTMPDQPPPPPPPVETPKPPPQTPALIASITATGVDHDGTEHPTASVKVEEMYETRTSPLVPYIFFDSGSSEIPQRYVKMASGSTGSFALAKLYNDERLQMYHEALNIVGRRMTAHSDATLTITGCNAGTSGGEGSRALSKARAEAVRDYFQNVWGISPDRLHVKSRDLPQNVSPVDDSDGIEENRRVELAADEQEILAPLVLDDTVRDATPPMIRFHPVVTAEAGIKQWSLDASQENATLKTFSGNGMPPRAIDWDLNRDQQHIPKAPGQLDYALHVEDSVGSTKSASNSIQIDQLTLTKKRQQFAGDAEIERYSLLLFNFKSAELTPGDKQLARQIRDRIKENSIVTVEGYCDRIGNADANHQLAEQRAHAVAELLGNQAIEARGSNELLYDNNLPEGRFYSRTVEVTVKTPSEQKQ